MAKKKKDESLVLEEVTLQNVTLDEPQVFNIAWAERILIEQSKYDGFKPFALPSNSEYSFEDGKLVKK